MIDARRPLHGTEERWSSVTTRSVWSATVVVVLAWLLIAMNRLGGLAFTEPRALVRFAVVGIWGWLALGVALWAIVAVTDAIAARAASERSVVPIGSALMVTGWAHVPVVVLAVFVFLLAGAMDVVGPGRVVAIVVFAMAVPLALVTGIRHIARCSIWRAIAIVAVPYVVWCAIVVRHTLDAIQHLL